MQPPEDPALIVSGTAGFIGGHLATRLAAAGRGFTGIDRVAAGGDGAARADIAELGTLSTLAAGRRNGTLIHLAAEAEVVMPWERIPCAFSSNLLGTWNLLTAFAPRLCLFASSSSVYGNAGRASSVPRWSRACPLGLYGATKSTGELLLRDWAGETGSSAVIFRFGNVVGTRCRGLIPYLVNHARLHPDGSVPAQLRGHGKLVRDYVPVGYVVSVLLAAVEAPWNPGRTEIYNIGTGRGLTNGAVGEIVRRILASRGYRLDIAWDNPVPEGEARSIVLDVSRLVRRFGLTAPTAEEVEAAIEQGVLDYLGA